MRATKVFCKRSCRSCPCPPLPMLGVPAQALCEAGRLFHARTALPLTAEELADASDSDDAVDEEHWARGCRRERERSRMHA